MFLNYQMYQIKFVYRLQLLSLLDGRTVKLRVGSSQRSELSENGDRPVLLCNPACTCPPPLLDELANLSTCRF
jgi:hypothetical protein